MALNPSQILALVGEALYGPRWLSGLAGDLRVNERTMRRWMAQTETPRPVVLADLAAIVTARQTTLGEVRQVLDRAVQATP